MENSHVYIDSSSSRQANDFMHNQLVLESLATFSRRGSTVFTPRPGIVKPGDDIFEARPLLPCNTIMISLIWIVLWNS